jgi:very-short-patch-repair endonuclease
MSYSGASLFAPSLKGRGWGLGLRMRRQPAGIVRGQSISAAKLALAKDLRREMTPEERMLWAELRGNRLKGIHFRRQQLISGFIADFYCDAARLAVELDDAYYDAQRDCEFGRLGVRVLRMENARVRENLGSVLEQICKQARERIQT